MSQATDPTFYRSPADKANDAMAVLDCDPSSPDYGQVVGWTTTP